MMFIGIDVHKSFSRLATFCPATEELRDLGSVPSAWETLCQEVSRIPGERCVVLEAGRNSHFLAAKLEAVATAVWIVDPAALRRIVGKAPKTDARDAKGLAEWAGRGALKPLYRPSAETLELRELTRGKQALTELATRARQLLRALLVRQGYELETHRDVLSKEVQSWLGEVAPKLPGRVREVLAQVRQVLPVLAAAAAALDPTIECEARAHPRARRLQTLPGVGWQLALAMAVEIDDAGRFPTPAKLRAYSGLCPQVYQTSDRTVYGRLTKRGNRYLRRAVGLAAQAASRRRDLEPRLRGIHTRAAFKHGRNPAKMELGRELLTLAYHLLVHDEDYQPQGVAA